MAYVHPELKRWRESRSYRENFPFFYNATSGQAPIFSIDSNLLNHNNNNTVAVGASSSSSSQAENYNNNTTTTPSTISTTTTTTGNNNNNRFPNPLREVQQLFQSPAAAASALKKREGFLRVQLDIQKEKHDDMVARIQKMKAKLAGMERELEHFDKKMEKRNDSVLAASTHLETLLSRESNNNNNANNNVNNNINNNAPSNENDWAPPILLMFDFLDKFTTSPQLLELLGEYSWKTENSKTSNVSSYFSKALFFFSPDQQQHYLVNNLTRQTTAAAAATSQQLQQHIEQINNQMNTVICPGFDIDVSKQQVVYHVPKSSGYNKGSAATSQAMMSSKSVITTTAAPKASGGGVRRDREDGVVLASAAGEEKETQETQPATQQKEGLWCELELCARYHFAKTLQQFGESEELQHACSWSSFCRDFSCQFQHHYVIARRFAMALNLLCFLVEVSFFPSSSNQQQQQQQQHVVPQEEKEEGLVFYEILDYVCCKFSEARALFENLDMICSAELSADEVSSSDETNANVVDFLSDWVLTVADDVIIKKGWLNLASSSSSHASGERIRHELRNFSSSSNTAEADRPENERISLMVLKIISKIRSTAKTTSTKEIRQQQQTSSLSSSSLQTEIASRLQNIQKHLSHHHHPQSQPEKACVEAASIFLKLLFATTATGQNQQRNEDLMSRRQQSFADFLQLTTHAITFLSSRDIMNSASASSLTSSLRQLYFLISFCIAQIFSSTNNSQLQKWVLQELSSQPSSNNNKTLLTTNKKQKFSNNQQEKNEDSANATTAVGVGRVLPLDPLSRWNCTVFICACLLTKGLDSNKQEMLEKFVAYQKTGCALLSLSDLIPLTSSFTKYREFVLMNNNINNNNQDPEDEQSRHDVDDDDVVDVFTICQSLIVSAREQIFFTNSVFSTSEILHELDSSIILLTLRQLSHFCFFSTHDDGDNNNNGGKDKEKKKTHNYSSLPHFLSTFGETGLLKPTSVGVLMHSFEALQQQREEKNVLQHFVTNLVIQRPKDSVTHLKMFQHLLEQFYGNDNVASHVAASHLRNARGIVNWFLETWFGASIVGTEAQFTPETLFSEKKNFWWNEEFARLLSSTASTTTAQRKSSEEIVSFFSVFVASELMFAAFLMKRRQFAVAAARLKTRVLRELKHNPYFTSMMMMNVENMNESIGSEDSAATSSSSNSHHHYHFWQLLPMLKTLFQTVSVLSGFSASSSFAAAAASRASPEKEYSENNNSNNSRASNLVSTAANFAIEYLVLVSKWSARTNFSVPLFDNDENEKNDVVLVVSSTTTMTRMNIAQLEYLSIIRDGDSCLQWFSPCHVTCCGSVGGDDNNNNNIITAVDKSFVVDFVKRVKRSWNQLQHKRF